MTRYPAFILPFLLAAAAVATPPRISKLSHYGGQQGGALRLVVTGTDLAQTHIETDLPAAFTELSRSSAEGDAMTGAKRDQMEFLVEIDEAAEPRPYGLRLLGERGVSNAVVFVVGLLPELDERAEGYGSGESDAVFQLLTPPVTVNGTLNGPERDTYEVEMEAGDSWVLEVEARRLGSAIDPFFQVIGPSGAVLARVDDSPGIGVDSRLAFTAPATGTYRVVVHDSKFSFQTTDFYRLKVGRFGFADGVFPLGGRRGETVDVEWIGGNLPESTQGQVDLRNAVSASALAYLDGSTLPLGFVASDLPEALETQGPRLQVLQADVVMNGRIETAGESDSYRLAVEPGERWLFEVQAGALGTSRLSAVISLHDSAGERLASAGDLGLDELRAFRLLSPTRTTGDPYLSFEVPPDLEAVDVRIEDLVGRGGPLYGYRLTARRSAPDFEIAVTTPYLNIPLGGTTVVRVDVDRHDYYGDIRLSIPDPPPGLTVRGGSVPREVPDIDGKTLSRSGALTLTAATNAALGVNSLEVWGEATLDDGSTVRRLARAPGVLTPIRQEDGRSAATAGEKPFTAPWLGLDFVAAVTPAAETTLATTAPAVVRLVKGAPLDIDWSWESSVEGKRPPRLVRIESVGPAELRTLTPPKDTYYSKQGTIHIRTSVGTPHDSFDVIPAAILEGGGRLYGPVTTLEVVQGYNVALSEQPRIVVGSSARIHGSVSRDPTFSQPVEVRADGLPSGIECRAREVAAEQEDFALSCRAHDQVEPGEYPFEIFSTSWLPGDQELAEYSIDPVSAVLIVEPDGDRVALRRTP